MDSLTAGAARLGINLTPGQVERFQRYYDLLVEWNRRINLTAILEYEDVQMRHFLDSLSAVLAFRDRLRDDGAGLAIVDVGSGAGLPGIPFKIVFPKIALVLVESVGKKTAFLADLLTKLELSGVTIITGRAEEIAHQRGCRERFDIVLARALAKMPTLAELTLPLCRLGGLVVAQKKGDMTDELAQAGPAISLFGGKVHEVKRVELPELSDGRCLIILEKVLPTPDKFPRRAGIPEKRPILPRMTDISA